MGRQDRPENESPIKKTVTGFSGSRLKQLQLARSRATHSMDEATSKQEAFRRWQSMNDSTTRKQDGDTGSVSSSLSLRGANGILCNKRSNNGPVVYVLPDTKPKESQAFLNERNRQIFTGSSSNSLRSLDQRFSPASTMLPHQQMREDLKLKYPHGMPRWGPRLVSATPSFEDTQDPMRDYISNIGGYKVQATAKSPNVNHYPIKNSNDNQKDSASFASEREHEEHSIGSTGRRSQSKSRQEAVVEKARTQSLLAAARAAQNMAATNCPSAKFFPKSATHNPQASGGLGSRLLGRRANKRSSLLQSARLQQSKVIHASDQLLHQTISLDGPLFHQTTDTNGVDRSVKSFDYLHRNGAVNGNHQASEAHSADNSALDNDEWDDDEADEHSWDMQSNIDNNDEQNTASQESNETSSSSAESESQQADLYGEQRSSIPTLIHSEVDHESSSLFSDFSSLAVNTRRDASQEVQDQNMNVHEEEEPYEEEFFDSAGSIRTAPTEAERLQRFDFRRCNELLSRRNTYLEKEERKQLISPQAAVRLANTPALSRAAADDKALQELASRGRWHLLKQKHEYKVTIPKALHQPLASLPDDNDGFGIKPISLFAPNTMTTPVNISKNVWHKPEAEDDKEEIDADGEDDTEGSGDGDTPNSKRPSRVKKFAIRCTPFLVTLLWVNWAYDSLRTLFLIQAISLGRSLHANTVTGSWKTSFQGLDVVFLNLSQSAFPGTTELALPEIFVLATIHYSPNETIQPTCDANDMTVDFWETSYDLEKHDTLLTEEPMREVSQFPPLELKLVQHKRRMDSIFLMDMSRDQTICDKVHSMCFQFHHQTSDEPLEEASLRWEKTQFFQNNEPDAKEDSIMSLYLDQFPSEKDDGSNDKNLLKKFALALQNKDFGAHGIRDKHVILEKIGDVLRTSAQNLPNNNLFNGSDNTLFHKVAHIMQKSSQNLYKVDPFNDIDDLASGDEKLLKAFVDVLRKPSEDLKEKRKRRRKLYHV